MELTQQTKQNEVDIPQKIFNQLILELEKTTVPKSVTDQLKETIITKGDFSEQSLRAAMIPNPEI
ncbi:MULTISPECIES: hypothetical protein [unclassified Sphingobacterium]|uniref:hypothetical protein n=1 Tax=unclassified Sphingobacterium TaxID=2609468 RepID=UPI0025DFFA1E|nr:MULTISPECIES: hypothetical protein [unclassified Sphingobacterium]